MFQKILNSPFFPVIVVILVLVAIFGGALVLYHLQPPSPTECNGGIALRLQTGEYFLLDGEPISWTGSSFQNGPGSEEYWNAYLNIGDGFAIRTGVVYNEDGSYDYHEWAIFRCGRSRFSVWRTQDLPADPFAPTPEPVADIK